MTADDQLHSHVTGEGIVNEHIDAPLLAGLHDGVALADFIGVQHDIGSGGDNGRILLGSAGNQQDVVTAHFPNLVEAGLGARDGLAHHDGLHVGIGSEGDDLGNGGLHLGHKVVRISSGHNVLGTIGGQSLLGGPELFLALGNGAGENGNLPVVIAGSSSGSGSLGDGAFGSGRGSGSGGLGLGAAGSHAQHHDNDQHQANHLFHAISSL